MIQILKDTNTINFVMRKSTKRVYISMQQSEMIQI